MTDSDDRVPPDSPTEPDDPEPEPDSDHPDDPVRVNHLYWLEQTIRYFVLLELLFPCIACSAYDGLLRTVAPKAMLGWSTEWVMATVMGAAGSFALILSVIGLCLSQDIDSRRWFVGGAILGIGWVVLTVFILLIRANFL